MCPLLDLAPSTEFSAEELERFECRYENGYDLNTDEKINKWLRMYHPDEYREPDQSSSFSDQVAMSERQQSKLLTLPDPLPAITLKPKQTTRVLTGPEFLQHVKEKELKKKEEALNKSLLEKRRPRIDRHYWRQKPVSKKRKGNNPALEIQPDK